MDDEQRARPAANETSLKRMMSGVDLLFLCIGVIVVLGGLFVSAAAPSSGWGIPLSIVGAAVYPLWITARRAGRPGVDAGERARAIMLGTLGAPLLVAAAAGILQVVAQFFPAYRTAVASMVENQDSFFSGVENPFAQSLIYPLLVWVMGAVAAFALIVIILLPLMAWARPHEAADGSRIEKIEERRQSLVTRLVFIGLSPLLLGASLWVLSGGDSISRFPAEFGWALQSLTYGNAPSGTALAFLFGVILSVIGGASVVLGCILTVVGSQRSAD